MSSTLESTHECRGCTCYPRRWSITLVEDGNKPTDDLKTPPKLADLPGEPGRWFSGGDYRSQGTLWLMQEQWASMSLIYLTEAILSVFWPLSWGQQLRKWRGGSTWLCHLFNWSDLICNRALSATVSSMGCSPGPWASWIILYKSNFCFPGLSPHQFFPLCLQHSFSSSSISCNLIIPCFMISWFSIQLT